MSLETFDFNSTAGSFPSYSIILENRSRGAFYVSTKESPSLHFITEVNQTLQTSLQNPNLVGYQQAQHFNTESIWTSMASSQSGRFLSTFLPMDVVCLFLKYIVIPYLLLLLACYLWEISFLRDRDPSSRFPLPNGKMGLPFIGEMIQFFVVGTKHQRNCQKKYGDVFRTHMFGRPTVIAVGEQHIRRILLGEGQIVQTNWPSTTRQILGEHGIVNGDKRTHSTIKRLALRTFSPKYMKDYATILQSGISEHIKGWEGKLSVIEICKQMVSKTMMTILLGIHQNDPNIQLYIKAADDIVNSIFSLPFNLPGFAFRKGLQAQKLVFKKLESELRSKMECSDEELFDESKQESQSILLNLIKIARKEKTKIELINLQNLSLEFIFAGTQSLQCVSSSMIVHLSQRPKIVERLRDEIREHGLWDKSMEEISFEEIQSLKLVDCVVKETMRVTPSIPGGVRVARKTFELGGYQVPKGWQVVYGIKLTHDAVVGDVLQDGPNCKFDPDAYFNCLKCKAKKPQNTEELFTTEYSKDGPVTSQDYTNDANEPALASDAHVCNETAGEYCYVPFGKGARMCAGKNYGLLFLRILVFELVRTTDFKLVGNVKFSAVPMTRPHKSVTVEFHPLKS